MLLDILNMVGIIACAVTGALSAGREKMDWFGVLMISAVTALGGGTVRDVTLAHFPLYWVREPEVLYIVAAFSFATILAAPFMAYLNSIFLFLDAIGMVAFCLIGAQIALEMGYGITLACVAGVSTGAFGGVIRDLLCNHVPLAFRNELYASIALCTAALYVILIWLSVPTWLAVIVGTVFGVGFRMLAIRYNWSLPVFEYSEERWKHVPFVERLPHIRVKRKLQEFNHRRKAGSGLGASPDLQQQLVSSTAAAQQLATELAQEAASEAAQQAAQQVAQQVAAQVAEQVAEQVTEQVTEKLTEQVSEQVAEQVTEQVTEKLTEQVSEQVAEQVTEQVVEQLSEQVSEQVSEQISEQVSEQISEQVHQEISKLHKPEKTTKF